MMILFEIRAKITAIYQRFDFWFKLVLKFALIMLALMRVKEMFSANATLSKTVVITALAAFCSVLPFSLVLLVMMAYLVLQILGASSLMAITVAILCLIMYCFFLRFTPEQGAAVLAVPVLRSFGIPYVVPITLGGFSDLFSIVPTCCGVFLYYMLSVIKDNLSVTLDVLKASDGAFDVYINVIDQLIKNPAVYVTMFAYALTIAAVYLVRRMRMDYSFEISIAVGTATMIVVNIIGGLKYDLGTSLVSLIVGAIVSGLIAFVFQFFYRVLDYAAAEKVQFEDDNYYYYVKAVPKIRVNAPKKPIRKVVSSRNQNEAEDEEELEDEVFDAFSEMVTKDELARSLQAQAETSGSTVELSDSGVFEDDEPVSRISEPSKNSARNTSQATMKGKTTVTKDGKVLNVIYDDDDDDDEDEDYL